jgi:two-component system alkaline phosphatase synthesis response regulator PhoP
MTIGIASGRVRLQTILVVDDEPRIADIARDYLQHAGYAVLTAHSGEDALMVARDRRPDLIVLDLRLPRLDGIDVARTLRRESAVPIIMLTARVDESDRLLGLEVGADDYITKPFSPRELVARVKAVLRRSTAAPTGDRLRIGDLTLDLSRMSASRGGTAIDLTTTEFQLLAALAARPGRVFTRAQLLDAIRGDTADAFDRAIDAHVKNLRRKIEIDPRQPKYILTVYGVGYKAADQ